MTVAFSDVSEIAVAASQRAALAGEMTAAEAIVTGSFRRDGTNKSAADALARVLVAPIPSGGLRVLLASGALTSVLPVLQKTVALSQESGRRHKDVWEHTLAVTDNVRSDLVLRAAALLHDIGKPDTLKFVPGKGATFHDHPAVGARLASASLRDMRWDAAQASAIVWLVDHHLRPAQHSSAWTESAVRRFMRECGQRAQLLMELSRADLTTRNPAKRARAQQNAAALEEKMRAVAELDARPAALLKGFGDWLASEWRLVGPEIGIVKRDIERRVEAGELPRQRETLTYRDAVSEAVERLRASRSEPERCVC